LPGVRPTRNYRKKNKIVQSDLVVDPLIAAANNRSTVFARWRPDVHVHRVHDSLGPTHSTPQTAARSVQPFLHGRCFFLHTLHCGPHFIQKFARYRRRNWTRYLTYLYCSWPYWQPSSNRLAISIISCIVYLMLFVENIFFFFFLDPSPYLGRCVITTFGHLQKSRYFNQKLLQQFHLYALSLHS